MKMKIPGIMNVILDFKTTNPYRKTAMGSQIIVGFMANTKIESENKNPNLLLEEKTSFKIIKEKAIAGKSVDGDCIKRNKTGKKSK